MVRAPLRSITWAVAKKLGAGVITSSPGPIASNSSAICMAAVAEVSERTCRPPKRSESAASKAATRGPLASQRLRSVSLTAAIIASSIVGRANGRKSINGSLASRPRHQKNADHDEGDAGNLLRGERFAEEEPRGNRVHDIAYREHRVSNTHGNARKRKEPHHHAHHVAGEPGEDVRIRDELSTHRHQVIDGKGEFAHPVGAGFEEQLRAG